MINTLTTHIAKSTMQLKEVNMCLSFVSTIWRDKPLLIVFNNLNNNIVSTFFDPDYQVGDLELLEHLIKDFLIETT